MEEKRRGAWREVGHLETTCSAEDFLSGVEVWVARPQVVNRRLLGAVIVEGGGAKVGENAEGGTGEDPTPADQARSHDNECVAVARGLSRCGGSRASCIVRELLPRMRSMEPRRERVTTDHSPNAVTVTFDPVLVDGANTVSSGCGSYRLQHLRGSPNRVSLSTYQPSGDEERTVVVQDGVTSPTTEWLGSVLLPKVVQWAEESAAGSVARKRSLVPLGRYSALYRELKDKYGPALIRDWPEATDPHKFVYEDIAIATYLIILWEEERRALGLTEKQSFIDLGCGNGLLVYLLSCEGHPGKGIDLRERKIWRMYGGKAALEVNALTPSDATVFPGFDWLIGNHSDELTPWIPLMAARSSYRTCYFVLPCCPHDFDSKFCRPNTSKSQYQSYLDYVQEIGETVGFLVEEDTLRIPSSKRVCHIGRKRSYSPQEEGVLERRRHDFLRARCKQQRRREKEGEGAGGLVEGLCGGEGGVVRGELGKGEWPETEEGWAVSREGGLEQSPRADRDTCGDCVVQLTDSVSGTGTVWSRGFVPRSSAEPSRNCACIDRNLQEQIVKTLTTALLETENWVEVKKLTTAASSLCRGNSRSHGGESQGSGWKGEERCSECGDELSRQETSSSPQTTLWNQGGQLRLNDAAALFDTATLRQLKQEYGGLQTLLRNHHQIFLVRGGHVRLRNWADREERPGPRKPARQRSKQDAQRLAKTKMCWFHEQHPQGCPRPAWECPYAHGQAELCPRPDFNTERSLFQN